jgi:hypothetical protein
MEFENFDMIEFKNSKEALNELLMGNLQTKAMLGTILEVQAAILGRLNGKSKEEVHILIKNIYDGKMDDLLHDLIKRTI